MTSVEECIGLPAQGYDCLCTYPKIDVDENMNIAISNICQDRNAKRYHIVHVKNGKPNLWAIKILENRFGAAIGEKLLQLSKDKKLKGLYSIGAYGDYIESYYRL